MDHNEGSYQNKQKFQRREEKISHMKMYQIYSVEFETLN